MQWGDRPFGVADLSERSLWAFKAGYATGTGGGGHNSFVHGHENHKAWELGYRMGVRDVVLGGAPTTRR